DISETMDILKHHVLLIESIQKTVISAEPRKLKMLLQNTETKRMKRADVHLVNVRNDAAIRQFVRNSCDKFFCCFLRESSNKNIFRLYATFLYEVNRTLNERIGLAGSRP